jgi:excisionase family DNA binding protein
MSDPTRSIQNLSSIPSIRRELAYTPAEAMALLRISRGTLYAHLNSGDLRSIKIGNKRLFLGRHLLSFLKLCERRARVAG